MRSIVVRLNEGFCVVGAAVKQSHFLIHKGDLRTEPVGLRRSRCAVKSRLHKLAYAALCKRSAC